eukprot:maker-scaffold70_size417918-snap-gene-3.18 protein:Tk01882 transcript:maker-scaffold70_size417918-snap-gene-3.18-mRNA-1 annotation:"leucine-rich repeat and wd repeat-containing protein kiaa1239-like"
MDEKTVDRIFAGCLEDLPPVSSKIVRIFTSSTFTDMLMERNTLMEYVYPKIKEYCREKHGLEFQVVDMRWGVRDEMTNEHMTTELCMTELTNCQRLSMGPNFIYFGGQKYGYRPIPTYIITSELRELREVLVTMGNDVSLLDKWYRTDYNSVPPESILQPIDTYLTHFLNKRVPKLQARDAGIWWGTLPKMQLMLRKASHTLYVNGKMTHEQMHNYHMAVTEREVINGCLSVTEVKDHIIIYTRIINNINLQNLKRASAFIDINDRKVDQEAVKLLAHYRDELLPQKMKENNGIYKRYNVEWIGREGLATETHEEYLNDFINHFYKSVIKLVDRAMRKEDTSAQGKIITEILQHLHACKNSVKVFYGRVEELEHLKTYIGGPSKQPFVLHGAGGSGKTAMLSMAACKSVNEWLSPAKPLLIVRYLGTTPDSSSLAPLLTSICQQLSYTFMLPFEDIPDDLVPLTAHMKELLNQATEEQPLLICLDSVDQLIGSQDGNKMSWLPTKLPQNCKIIVSVTREENNSLLCQDYELLTKMIEEKQNFLEVKALGEDLAWKVIKLWMEAAGRDLNNYQWRVVANAVAKCSLPIFCKLVFAEICRWKSYSKPQDTYLAHSVMDSIFLLFEKVETKHGWFLVSHALAYVTAAKSGVSETELEDLISLDDKVLDDIYQYHLPPVRRIPPLLWTRVRSDLPGYLSDSEADGSKDSEADRQIPAMPLVFYTKDGKISRYNLRKFGELPYHLVRCKQFEDLYSNVLFNYQWLYAKMSACPLQAVLSDFEDACNRVEDKDAKREIMLVADSLRLGGAILGQYPDMLAPQLVGRLLSEMKSNRNIRNLLRQCDEEGLVQNALVPTYHCMHTPGGPLKYSLEGHQFAVFGFNLTSDFRYIVSVSNKFITWDVSTSDLARQVHPGVEGLMMDLEISPDNRFVAAYTNNNQTILLNNLISEFIVINNPLNKDTNDVVKGLCLLDTNLIVYGQHGWVVFDMAGKELQNKQVLKDIPILKMKMDSLDNFSVLYWSGEEGNLEMTVETYKQGVMGSSLSFFAGIALNKDHTRVWLCDEEDCHLIREYVWKPNGWSKSHEFPDNKHPLLMIELSMDEIFVIGTFMVGFQLWRVKDGQDYTILKLPSGIRNISTKMNKSNSCVLSSGHVYAVAGIRKELYIWSMATGQLVKCLDAHFARIIDIQPLTIGSWNSVITSSIDRTVKVWNMNYIFEQVHHIDRHELQIDSVNLCTQMGIAVTVTRNCIGIWDLLTGKLQSKLADSALGAIVTHALVTNDGQYIIAAESGLVLIWSVSQKVVLFKEEQKDILQVMFYEDEHKFMVVSKTGVVPELKARAVSRAFPEGEKNFEFDFPYKQNKNIILTSDAQFFIAFGFEKMKEMLFVYHAETGDFLHKILVKYPNFKEVSMIVALPDKPGHVALVDLDKGNIMDVKNKKYVRSIPQWGGHCSKDGRYGLYAPSRGGLDMLDLRHGTVVRTLIPKIAEGIFNVICKFNETNEYILYYHSGRKTLRIFRVADGVMIANYRVPSDLSSLESTTDGNSVVLGMVDGNLTVLTIADPKKPHMKDYLRKLPSRNQEDLGAKLTGKSARKKSPALKRRED